MTKSLYIAEKPSVAQQFAAALKKDWRRKDGYLEAEDAVVTWCVGHLVTMSYPEAYDPKYRRWSLQTLPFLPKEFKYQVIEAVSRQFQIVSGLLNRADVDTIYICTDSGREGEYIYRLVDQMAGVRGKTRRRVWIDSQTEEEILRGIREARDWSEYDNLSASAYLRAKEDYLMGINFSRLLTLKYGETVSGYLKSGKRTVLSVGRVMTCVLGMTVRREREIRNFVKTPFYRVTADVAGPEPRTDLTFEAEWRAVKGSRYFETPFLYKDNGLKERKTAEELTAYLSSQPPLTMEVLSAERKKELKNPPLLYNLAELQNDCSRMFKISPDETLRVVQELYERKLVTYPRTDARVLSTAAAKEIHRNVAGLKSFAPLSGLAGEVLESSACETIRKSRYVNDKQITDHYALVPTGQGLAALKSLPPLSAKVYEVIARRFLGIFLPPAVYQKTSLEMVRMGEHFFSTFKVLTDPGYLRAQPPQNRKKDGDGEGETDRTDADSPEFLQMLASLRKGQKLAVRGFSIKEGETSPPKRYTSGSMILAMENAGQLIEDEELRAQIKGSGIGTSATRAEILKKLVHIQYLALNKKTQVITPTLLGELVYEVVNASIRQLLNPELTASWEKGLSYVAEGSITSEEYMTKLEHFVAGRTYQVLNLQNQYALRDCFDAAAVYYSQSSMSRGDRRHEKGRNDHKKAVRHQQNHGGSDAGSL